MRRILVLIPILALWASLFSSIPAAHANTGCQAIGVSFPGTQYEADFGVGCTTEEIAQLTANKATYEAQVAVVIAEQARADAEAAAAAAADAANCVEPITSFTGDARWVRTFPGVCTAAAIAARAIEVENYFNYVTEQRLAEQNSNPNPPPPPPANVGTPQGGYVNNPDLGIDCSTPEGMQTAWCINQQQGYNPVTGEWNAPQGSPAWCALPGNSGSALCQPVMNIDGTLNCANPVNVTTAQCMGNVPTSQDCSLPQNLALPFCVNAQPMYNQDGSLNCAQPANATMAACLNLFKTSETGQLNCALPELQNMPICKQGNVAITGAPASNVTTAPALPAMTSPGMPAVNLPQSGQSNQQGSAQNKVVVSEKATKDKEESFAESDGEEEEPTASLSVTFNASQNRYVIRVDSNLAGEQLTIRATKKGAKSLRYSLSIDEDGVGGVRTKSKLAGFTLTLFYGSIKLDQVRVR